MLFNNISLAIFLSPDGLKILNLKSQAEMPIFQFPKDSVVHQEVVNEKALVDGVTKYLKSLANQTGEAVLFLHSQLVYLEILPPATQDLEQKIQEFFDVVPLDANKVATKTIQYNNQTTLLATNKRFYAVVLHVFEQHGWKIEYVIPSPLFISKDQEQNIDLATLNKVFASAPLLQLGNFLDSTTPHKTSSLNRQAIVLPIIIVLLLLLNILVGGLVLGKIPTPAVLNVAKNNNKVKPAQKVVKAISTKESSPSAQIQKDVRIQILNGSGIAGLAASASAILKGGEFNDIKTGNAASSSTDTTIEYNSKVNKATVVAVEKILTGMFEKIETTRSADLDDTFDIVITTGRLKK